MLSSAKFLNSLDRNRAGILCCWWRGVKGSGEAKRGAWPVFRDRWEMSVAGEAGALDGVDATECAEAIPHPGWFFGRVRKALRGLGITDLAMQKSA